MGLRSLPNKEADVADEADEAEEMTERSCVILCHLSSATFATSATSSTSSQILPHPLRRCFNGRTQRFHRGFRFLAIHEEGRRAVHAGVLALLIIGGDRVLLDVGARATVEHTHVEPELLGPIGDGLLAHVLLIFKR